MDTSAIRGYLMSATHSSTSSVPLSSRRKTGKAEPGSCSSPEVMDVEMIQNFGRGLISVIRCFSRFGQLLWIGIWVINSFICSSEGMDKMTKPRNQKRHYNQHHYNRIKANTYIRMSVANISDSPTITSGSDGQV